MTLVEFTLTPELFAGEVRVRIQRAGDDGIVGWMWPAKPYYRTTVLTWEEMACADLESMRAIDEVCHEVRSTLAAWSAAVCEANRRLRSEPGVEVDLPEPQTVRIDEARLRIRPT